jgi:hypothetical protein
MSDHGVAPDISPGQWNSPTVSCSRSGLIIHDASARRAGPAAAAGRAHAAAPTSPVPDVIKPRSRLAGCTNQKEALDGE